MILFISPIMQFRNIQIATGSLKPAINFPSRISKIIWRVKAIRSILKKKLSKYITYLKDYAENERFDLDVTSFSEKKN